MCWVRLGVLDVEGWGVSRGALSVLSGADIFVEGGLGVFVVCCPVSLSL